jgi:hypothetical protein
MKFTTREIHPLYIIVIYMLLMAINFPQYDYIPLITELFPPVKTAIGSSVVFLCSLMLLYYQTMLLADDAYCTV